MVDTAYKVDAVAGGSATHANGSAPAVRDLALDLVKGALVVVRVVYHAVNVFSTAGPDEYACVRFVSGCFTLMSGYLTGIGNPSAGLAMLCDRYRFVAKAYKLTFS
jgi:hypothetical protein